MRYLIFILLIGLFNTGKAEKINYFLVARNVGTHTINDSTHIPIMGFAERLSNSIKIPSPVIEATVGDTVTIQLLNMSQGAPHTIHLHGLDVPQKYDGVPNLSPVVKHSETFEYVFVAENPGTFLYHCHVVSVLHVQAGMYGNVIVRPKEKNTVWFGQHNYTKEFNLLTSEIDTNWHTRELFMHNFHEGNDFEMEVPDYNPQYFIINGQTQSDINRSGTEIKTAQNANNLIRISNIGNYGNKILFPSGVDVITSDGRILPESVSLDELFIYPGERYQVLYNNPVTQEDSLVINYFNLNSQETIDQVSIPLKNDLTSDINIDDKIFDNIKVHQNPIGSTSYLSVKNKSNANYEINLLDLNGKVIANIFRGQMKSGESRFPLINLLPNKGVYFINIKSEKSTKTIKIVY